MPTTRRNSWHGSRPVERSPIRSLADRSDCPGRSTRLHPDVAGAVFLAQEERDRNAIEKTDSRRKGICPIAAKSKHGESRYFFTVASQLTMTVMGGVVVSPIGMLTRNRPFGAGD